MNNWELIPIIGVILFGILLIKFAIDFRNSLNEDNK